MDNICYRQDDKVKWKEHHTAALAACIGEEINKFNGRNIYKTALAVCIGEEFTDFSRFSCCISNFSAKRCDLLPEQ